MDDRLTGIILGTAVGDSLGLPAERVSPRRRVRLLPGPWRQRLVFGRGLLSDDTEHTFLVAQSLLSHSDDPTAFQRCLARQLRWWFASLPPAVGKATARACIKLWLGVSPQRSGVFSAGNGPAMRAAVIGGYFRDDPARLESFVRNSAQVTHTDPKAATGALAIARIAAWASAHDVADRPTEATFEMLESIAPADGDWRELVSAMRTAHHDRISVVDFAIRLGLARGVTGYMYHSVPVAAYAWLRHYGDFRATVEAALDCGGDADTVGAIAGGLAGASVGASGIPDEWLRGIIDWPCSITVLRKVAAQLETQRATGVPCGRVAYFWPAMLPRNLLLLLIVLFHGFRRLAPPY